MNDTKIPDISVEEAIRLRNLFNRYFDENSRVREVNERPDTDYPTVEKFVDHLEQIGIPKKLSIKNIGILLERAYENALSKTQEGEIPQMVGAEKPFVSRRLTPDELKELQEAAASEVKRRENIEQSAVGVRAAIERKKQIYDEQLKKIEEFKKKHGKEDVYVKPKMEVAQAIPGEYQVRVDVFKKIVDESPETAVNTIAQDIRTRTENEVSEYAAQMTAVYVVANIQNNSLPNLEGAVAQKLKGNPEFSAWISPLADMKKGERELAEMVWKRSYGTSLNAVVPEIKDVEISESSQPGFTSIPPTHFLNESENSLKDQKSALTAGASKEEWQQSAVARQLGLIRRGAIQGQGVVFSEQLIQNLASFGPNPSVSIISINQKFDAATGFSLPDTIIQNLATKAVSKGAGKLVAGVTGKAFGVGAVAATESATTAAGTAVSIGTSKGLGAILGTIFGGIPGFIAGLAIGKLLEKPISNLLIWLKKHQDLLGSITVGGVVSLFGAPLLGIGLGSLVFLLLTRNPGATLGSVVLFGRKIALSFVLQITVFATIIFLVFSTMVAFVLFIINSGAYVVPPAPIILSSGATITSPYIDVSKVAVPPGPFENNKVPVAIEYQITIKAKKSPLTNIKIKYECSVIKKLASADCPKTDPSVPSGIQIPNSISPAKDFSFSYKQILNLQDSLFSDTVTVTADTPEKSAAVAAASAGVKIGNPPDTCPSGWPVSGSYSISQTPGGSFSHLAIEAMDIATPFGVPVKATHSGIAHVVRTSGPYRPIYVDVASNCGGKQFVSRYAHLLINSIAVRDGQQVTMGQVLGASGTNTTPDNAHLHYEFIGLKMTPPYIPKAIRRGCSTNCGSIP